MENASESADAISPHTWYNICMPLSGPARHIPPEANAAGGKYYHKTAITGFLRR